MSWHPFMVTIDMTASLQTKNIKQFEETPSPQDFIAAYVMASLHGDPIDDYKLDKEDKRSLLENGTNM